MALPTMSDRKSPMAILRNRPLMILASGHFNVDMYTGLLPVLYPILTDRFNLDLATVGLVTLAYSGTASVSQPFFGWIADRYGTRFTGIALIWSAILFSTIGFAPTFPILLTLAALAGLGSGAFHPFGALNANAVIDDRDKNTAMSIYVTGGTLGVALGPIIGAVLFSVFGMRGTAIMLLPGATIAVWLFFAMQSASLPGRRGRKGTTAPAAQAVPGFLITIVTAVMMLRMLPPMSLQTFIPIWYKDLGYGASFYGALATTVVLASAAGTIGAGNLADRYGRRAVILGSILLSLPAIWAFAEFPGQWAFVTGALVGFLAASTGPLLLVMGQQLMVGRAGVASGLLLGLGFVAAAIATPIFGAIADAIGMQNAMRTQIIVIVLTFAVAWFLPTEERIRAFQKPRNEPAPAALTATPTVPREAKSI
jgi:MFS transporter, FSR family, fosmidomycin resistance protein